MIQTVIKRDGRVVGYNEEKIKAAIRKAMITTEKGEDESLIQKITDRNSGYQLQLFGLEKQIPVSRANESIIKEKLG